MNKNNQHFNQITLVLFKVLAGLVYLHDECNIIHTDIKPENILIKVKDSYVKKMVSTTKKFYDLGVLMPKSYGKWPRINSLNSITRKIVLVLTNILWKVMW